MVVCVHPFESVPLKGKESCSSTARRSRAKILCPSFGGGWLERGVHDPRLKHLGIDPRRFRHKRNADLLERTDPGSRPRLVPLPASRRPSTDSCPCPMFLVLGLDPWLCHPHLRDVGYRCVCCQDLDPTIGIFPFPHSLVSGDPRGGGQDASPPPSSPSFVLRTGAGGYGSLAFRGGGRTWRSDRTAWIQP